jgi:hypothetical protein
VADLSSLLGGIGGAGGGGGAGGAGPAGGALAELTTMEVVIDGDRGYVRSPALQTLTQAPTPWFSADAGELASMFGGGPVGSGPPASAPTGSDPVAPGSTASGRARGVGAGMGQVLPLATDPSALLEMLAHGGSEVVALGTERIDGDDTTHYRATVAVDDAVAGLDPATAVDVRALLGALGEQATGAPVPVDVWVGTSGLVRRVTVAATPAAGAGASITVDYLEPGAPVDIAGPDPATTTPLGPMFSSSLGKLLGG